MVEIVKNGRLLDSSGSVLYNGINGHLIGLEPVHVTWPIKFLLVFHIAATPAWKDIDVTKMPNPPLRLEGPNDYIEFTLSDISYNPDNKVALLFTGYAK